MVNPLSLMALKDFQRQVKANAGRTKRKDRLARRSLRNPIRCFDQAAASAAAFLRFLRQPSRPNAPRPEAKSGSAPGSGVGAVGKKVRMSMCLIVAVI